MTKSLLNLFSAAARSVLGLALFAVLLTAPDHAHAAVLSWSGSGAGPGTGAGSAWLTPGNWTNNAPLPTTNDIALFGLGGTAGPIGINFNGINVTNTYVGAIVLGLGSTIDRTIGNSSTTAGGTLNIATINGGAVTNLVGGRTLTLAPVAQGGSFPMGLTFLSNATFNAAAGASNNVTVIISGTANITNTGAGQLALLTTNTYTGKTIVNAGTLLITNETGLGGNPAALTADQLTLNAGTLRITNSSVVIDDVNRGLTLGSGGGTIQLETNATLNLSAVIAGGAMTLNGANNALLVLASNNTFTGAATINSGIVELRHNNALGTTAGNTLIKGNTVIPRLDLNLAAGLNVAEPLTLEARQAAALNSATVRNVAGANTLSGLITLTTGGSRYNFQVDGGSLTLAGNLSPAGLTGTRELRFAGNSDANLNGQVTAGGSPIDFALIKEGTGKLTLNNNIIPPGRTYVSQGTLVVGAAGLLTNSSIISVAAGATLNVSAFGAGFNLLSGQNLGGSGVVTGSVNAASGAIVSPGGDFAAGTLLLTNSSLTMNSGSRFSVDLDTAPIVDSGSNDLLIVNGNLTLIGTVPVGITPLAGLPAAGAYTIIRYTGILTGGAANLIAAPGPYTATFDDTTPGEIRMTVSGTPPALVWAGTNTNWDVESTFNFTNSLALPAVFTQGATTLFDDTATNFTVNVTTNVAPTATTVNAATSYTFTGSALSGGSLTKMGSGTLNLNNSNSHAGVTIVSGGLLKMGNAAALGTTNAGTTVGNGATLDLNGNAPLIGASSFESFVVAGAGLNGTGAVINTGAGLVNTGLRGVVTLSGDTTFGGINRWDVFGGKLNGNGFKLSKTGPPEIALSNLGDTGLGDVDILQGQLTFLGTSTMGDPTKTLTVFPNTTLAYWAPGNNVLNKNVALSNAIVINNSGVVASNIGPHTLLLSNTFNHSSDITLGGVVAGGGSLAKAGTGQLILTNANTYTGDTRIFGGRLTLTASGTITTTPTIDVKSGAIFDVSQYAAVGGYPLASGQTLLGVGSVVGGIIAPAGSTVSAGASPGTLNISSNLTTTGGTLVYELNTVTNEGGGLNDLINVTNLDVSGGVTVRVVPFAGPLSVVNPYTLINYTNALTGGPGNFTVVSDSRYAFAVSTLAGTPNKIRLAASGTPASLVWLGDYIGLNPQADWDVRTTPDWTNGVSTDVFYHGDAVTFDDSASSFTVNLVGNLPAGSILVNAGGNYTFIGSGKLSGGSLTRALGGTLIVANSGINDWAGGTFINAGTLQIGNGGIVGNLPASGGITNNGSLVFNRSDAVTVANLVTGTGSIVKQNTNLLTLSGVNTTYNGDITVSGGTLRGATFAALGTNLNNLTVAPGATFDFNAVAITNRTFIVSGSGVGGAGALVNNGAGQNNATRLITLAGDATFGGSARWDLRATNTAVVPLATLSTMGNAYNLTKVGVNQVSLVSAAVDPALGDIDVQGGILSFEVNTTSLGDPTKTLTIRSNASLQFFAATNQLNKNIVLNNGNIINNSGANGIVGPITLLGSNTFNIGGTSLSVSNIGSTGFLTKATGAGILYILGDDTHSGGTLISAGTVQIGSNGVSGSMSGPITNNATLQFARSDSYSYAGGIYGSAGTVRHVGGAGPLTLGGTIQASTIQPQGGSSNTASAVTLNSSAVVNAGSIAVGGANTGGKLILDGANVTIGNFFLGENTSQTGIVSHVNATVNITNQFRLGHFPTEVSTYTMNGGSLTMTNIPTAQVNQSGAAEQNGIIYVGVDGVAFFTQQAGAVSAHGLVLDARGSSALTPNTNTYALEGGTITLGPSGFKSGSSDTVTTYNLYLGGGTVGSWQTWTSALRMRLTGTNGNTTFNASNTTTILLNGVLAGPGGLVKEGGGTLLLNNTNNSFSGSVTVNAGTLGGTGAISGPLLVGIGGTLSPGSSPGVLLASNGVTLSGTTLMEVSRSGQTFTNDRLIVVAGTLNFGGSLIVSNIGNSLIGGEVFDLFDWATASGTFASVSLPALAPNLSWDTSTLYVDGIIKVVGPPTLLLAPVSQTVYEGDNVIFTAQATNIGALSTRWQKNGLDIPGATANTLSLPNVVLSNAGTYSFVASNAFGQNSASATLTVLPVSNLLSGLVAYWPLDTVTGDFTPDSTTNGNHLFLTNMTAANVVAGVRSNAMSFDGVSQLLTRSYSAGNVLPANQYQGFSVAMWVKGASNQADRRVFSESSNTGANNQLVNIGTDNGGASGKVDLFLRTDSGTALLNHSKSTNVAYDNTWRHIALVDNNGTVQLYIDGVLDQYTTNYPRGTLTLNTIAIGGIQRATAASWFGGQIDDVTIWRRALRSNEVACVMTNGANPPLITQQPVSQTADCSSNATFTVVVADSYSPLSYQWYFGATPISNATNSTLTVVASFGTAGAYSVVVSNCACQVVSATAILTVAGAQPLAITSQPQSRTNNVGTTATFGVTATSCGPTVYQWCFGANALAGETNATLSIANVQLSHAGNYQVKLSNSEGSVTSVVAVLTVNRVPIARDNGGSTTENRPLSIVVAKLISNDTDDDGDPLSVVGVSATSTNGGGVVLASDRVTYTPLTGFVGVDRFTYTISDGRGGSASAIVEILVVSGNLPGQNQISISLIPNGVRIRFAGIPGSTYDLQRAPTVTGPWNTIATRTAPLHGIIEYDDTTVTGTAFYRIAVP